MSSAAAKAAWTTDLIALDLGNSGGRLHLGEVIGDRLILTEIHQFENGPVQLGSRWYWDFFRLWQGIEEALTKVGHRLSGPATIGIASFGVDYTLLDRSGAQIGAIRHMRDPRTAGLFETIYRALPKPQLYARTGAMEIEINTLVQLVADRRDQPWLLDVAAELHLVPDYVTYLLTSRRSSEISIASTSQLIDPRRRAWDRDLMDIFGLPHRLFAPLVEAGSMIGRVTQEQADRLGLRVPVQVVAVASHDTASAAAAVPYADREHAAFISFGTWALVGRERAAPDLSNASLEANFTNECGVDGSIIHHKIQAGLWLLQETRRVLSRQGQRLSFEEIEAEAALAPELSFVFDPDDAMFRDPVSMPEAIAAWFAQRGLPAPATLGELARSIYESLALACARSVDAMASFGGPEIDTLHVVGGGAKIPLLMQAIANAAGRRVVAGPVEATVAGNMVGQLVARRVLADFAAGRELIRRSFEVAIYPPQPSEAWAAASRTFLGPPENRRVLTPSDGAFNSTLVSDPESC